MPRTVFILMHLHITTGHDAKLIGVYRSRVDAEQAIDRLRSKPGFREWPDGFSISEYEVGKDQWNQDA